MKKITIAFILALTMIAGTVVVTHVTQDSAKVAAEPDGG